MDVILFECVVKLGQMGDIVVVKDGYVCNFLLFQGKVLCVNEVNKVKFDVDKVQLEVCNFEIKKEVEDLVNCIGGEQFIVICLVLDVGVLYGLVILCDIVDIVGEGGFLLDKK